MNGARSLLDALVASGVEICFANPGTSEMHFVAALDQVPALRGVLALFEGVATGAADGYGRMTGRPAATLLHLGPGLGNGWANLHNARRAHTPLVNIVGDHATYHKRFDAPLESDIVSVATSVSQWVRTSARAQDLADDAADAVAAALGPPAGVATLILPADVSWSPRGSPESPPEAPQGPQGPPGAAHPTPAPAGLVPGRVPGSVPVSHIEDLARILRGPEPVALLLGGRAVTERGLRAAARVAATTSARLLGETFPARLARGAGLVDVERLGYFAEFAQAQLAGARHLVLCDASRPVSFFAYPGRPSDLVPPGCTVHVLAGPPDDPLGALEALAEALGAPQALPPAAPLPRPSRPTGALTLETFAAALGATLPEGAVVVDESNTSGIFVPGATAGGPRHDWLTLTGGAIGQGMPVATGAALGAPGRPVICLESDGSALYTFQALWTQVREGLDVTTLVLANRSYAILNIELARVGAEPAGARAAAMLDLSRPTLDFVALATAMGALARRVDTAEELAHALDWAQAQSGPVVIEVPLPPLA